MQQLTNIAKVKYISEGQLCICLAKSYFIKNNRGKNMNCNFNLCNNCNSCNNFVRTINVTQFGEDLLLTVPQMSLCNCKTLCVHVAQAIPECEDSNVKVVIQTGDAGAMYDVVTPCCGNYLYADQVHQNRTYCFKFASDTNTFIYKGGWRICPTQHVFNCVPIPTAAPANSQVEE